MSEQISEATTASSSTPAESTTSSMAGAGATASSAAPQGAAGVTASPSGSPEAAAAVAAYTPNYKFRYMDELENKIDGEIDEWARPFINQDTEEKFRQLWAKAHGLDFVKNRFNKTRGEYQAYRQQIDPLVQSWQELTGLYQKGDMDSFFKGLQIPEDKIFQYVLDKLNYERLPADQRAHIEKARAAETQAMELQRQNQALAAQYQQAQVQTRTTELQQALSSLDVSAVAQAFDARVGREGAFRDEVVKRGVLAWHTTGQDISSAQAIQEVMQLYGAFTGGQQTAAHMAQAASPGGAPAVSQAQKAPTLPNVGGNNASPARKAPKSLDELKKLAAQMG